jgi:branched-chain amino acid transport system permease protein/urea transport system permease protein
VEILLNALTATSVLALVAVGLYVVYGLMGVINMAHGEMLTLGAYTMVVLVGAGVDFWLAVGCATVLLGAIGLLLEVGVVRHLYGVGGLSTLLATWGLSIVIQQALRLHFGPSGQYIDAPTGSTTDAFGFPYPVYRLVLLGISLAALGVVILVFRRTRAGLVIRAAMDGRDRAELMGIDTKRVYRLAFVGGSALAGLAGALIAPLAAVTPLMGLEYVVQSFLVVMLGGVQTVLAPLGGAALIAGVTSLATNVVSATFAQTLTFALVFVAVALRPHGLFGKERR